MKSRFIILLVLLNTEKYLIVKQIGKDKESNQSSLDRMYDILDSWKSSDYVMNKTVTVISHVCM